jgi:hypothetical protein
MVMCSEEEGRVAAVVERDRTRKANPGERRKGDQPTVRNERGYVASMVRARALSGEPRELSLSPALLRSLFVSAEKGGGLLALGQLPAGMVCVVDWETDAVRTSTGMFVSPR